MALYQSAVFPFLISGLHTSWFHLTSLLFLLKILPLKKSMIKLTFFKNYNYFKKCEKATDFCSHGGVFSNILTFFLLEWRHSEIGLFDSGGGAHLRRMWQLSGGVGVSFTFALRQEYMEHLWDRHEDGEEVLFLGGAGRSSNSIFLSWTMRSKSCFILLSFLCSVTFSS